MKTNPDEPINPIQGFNTPTKGLTKREYFAAMALQGMIGSLNNFAISANDAVKAADALIEALNQATNERIHL